MKKLLCTTLAVGIMSSMSFTPAFALVEDNVLPQQLPQLPEDVTNEKVTTNGTNMNIVVGSGQKYDVDTIIWKDYNIGAKGKVNYVFTNHHQTSINKVDAAGGLSQIYGDITNSSCAGCGYEKTGKVFLINPNGVLFGEGADVNLNSFTVSTLDINTHNNDYTEVGFKKGEKTGNIIISPNAVIRGEKTVNLVSGQDIVTLQRDPSKLSDPEYKSSLISTSTQLNYDSDGDNILDTAYGKVKLITADGVSFTYYNNGAVKSVQEEGNSQTNVMTIQLSDTRIESGSIDIRNYSDGVTFDEKGNIVESEINLNGAVLKAVKAEKGNDGNIWLISNRKIILDGEENADGSVQKTILETVNYSDAAADRVYKEDGNDVFKYGEVYMKANNNISVDSSEINAVGDVEMTTLVDPNSNLPTVDRNITIENSIIYTPTNVNISANNIASIQNGSTVNANNVNINAKERAQVTRNSTVKAANNDINDINNIKMASDIVWISNSKLEADNAILAEALTENYHYDGGSAGNVRLENADLIANEIKLNAKNLVSGTANLNNSKTYINAGTDINLNLANVGKYENGLVAKAGTNMTIEADGTLSVSSLISGNNMTLTANEIIAGKDKIGTTKNYLKEDGDSADRSYIQVGGKFESNPNYTVTDSADLTPDRLYNKRHHIYYGSAENPEEILLVNQLPASAQQIEPTPLPNVNDDQASMLNRLPQQPQTISPSNNITDGRTSFIDVFAAASQIEIEDDEE